MAVTVLLIVVGVWLLLQTLVGDLPRRILSWRTTLAPGTTPEEALSGGKTLGDPIDKPGKNLVGGDR